MKILVAFLFLFVQSGWASSSSKEATPAQTVGCQSSIKTTHVDGSLSESFQLLENLLEKKAVSPKQRNAVRQDAIQKLGVEGEEKAEAIFFLYSGLYSSRPFHYAVLDVLEKRLAKKKDVLGHPKLDRRRLKRSINAFSRIEFNQQVELIDEILYALAPIFTVDTSMESHDQRQKEAKAFGMKLNQYLDFIKRWAAVDSLNQLRLVVAQYFLWYPEELSKKVASLQPFYIPGRQYPLSFTESELIPSTHTGKILDKRKQFWVLKGVRDFTVLPQAFFNLVVSKQLDRFGREEILESLEKRDWLSSRTIFRLEARQDRLQLLVEKLEELNELDSVIAQKKKTLERFLKRRERVQEKLLESQSSNLDFAYLRRIRNKYHSDSQSLFVTLLGGGYSVDSYRKDFTSSVSRSLSSCTLLNFQATLEQVISFVSNDSRLGNMDDGYDYFQTALGKAQKLWGDDGIPHEVVQSLSRLLSLSWSHSSAGSGLKAGLSEVLAEVKISAPTRGDTEEAQLRLLGQLLDEKERTLEEALMREEIEVLQESRSQLAKKVEAEGEDLGI